MTEKEVRRRLAALIALAPEKRPVTVMRLAQLANVSDLQIRALAKGQNEMRELTRARLSRALKWVEGDQVVVEKTPNRPTRITIREPRPPVRLERVLQITAQGVRLGLKAFNPNAFPPKR